MQLISISLVVSFGGLKRRDYHKYTISGIQATAKPALVKHNFCFCCPSEEELAGLSVWGIFLVKVEWRIGKGYGSLVRGCQALHGWHVISLTIPSLTSNFVRTVSAKKRKAPEAK